MVKATPLVTNEWVRAKFSKLEREIRELRKQVEKNTKWIEGGWKSSFCEEVERAMRRP